MQVKANTPQQYIDLLPADRKEVISKLRDCMLTNLPKGFIEIINYNMLGYVGPHSLYLPGYHCDPKQPLPFINIASQKKFVAIYHMGIYSNKQLLAWFVNEYQKYSKAKLDMGKSCIRFKKLDQIPYQLIGELAAKITPYEWIVMYETEIKNKL